MRSVAIRALGMGAITGLRSTAGPAALSSAISAGRLENLDGAFFALLGSPGVSAILTLFEIGEIIVDKLPIVPSRSAAAPLVGRAFSGAIVGAALFASDGRHNTTGAVLGAVAAACAGERLRTCLDQQLELPDFLVALLEDGIVLSGSAYLMR